MASDKFIGEALKTDNMLTEFEPTPPQNSELEFKGQLWLHELRVDNSSFKTENSSILTTIPCTTDTDKISQPPWGAASFLS